MTVVNLQHVLTQDLGHTPAHVMKDILEMGKHVKVKIEFNKIFCFLLTMLLLIQLFFTLKYNSFFLLIHVFDDASVLVRTC